MEWERLVIAAASLAALSLIYKLLVKWIGGILVRRDAPIEAQNGIRLVFRLVVSIVAILIVLWGVGLDASSLSIFAGVAALTVGLAGQQILGNLVAGIYLILARPFRVGDAIIVGPATTGIEGVVVQITLNYTRLKTRDKIYVSISNQQLVGKEILNYRYEEGKTVLYRYPIGLDFDYSLSVERMEKILSSIAERYKGKFAKSPEFYSIGVSDAAMKFIFAIFVKDPEELFTLKHQLVGEILQAREKAKSQKH